MAAAVGAVQRKNYINAKEVAAEKKLHLRSLSELGYPEQVMMRSLRAKIQRTHERNADECL